MISKWKTKFLENLSATFEKSEQTDTQELDSRDLYATIGQLKVENESEFISKDFDKWAYENNITLDFSRPGKATDNPYIESFNGSFRDEYLNVNWFMSFEDAEDKIEDWRHEYNHFRPHSSLNNLTPMGYIKICQSTSPET